MKCAFVDLLFDKVVLRVDGKAVLLQMRDELESSAGSHNRVNNPKWCRP